MVYGVEENMNCINVPCHHQTYTRAQTLYYISFTSN